VARLICNFSGNAVYIYGIDVQNPANISFSMDDPPLKSFHYQNTGDHNIYVYDSLFFQAANLAPDTQHTVTWVLEKGSLGGGSALFDYAVVTANEVEPSSSTTPQ
jgi:hypothetical protein